MPFTRRQIDRILDERGTPVIQLGRSNNLTLRVTESYLRRKLYALEDRVVGQQWDIFDAAFKDVRSFAVDEAQRQDVRKLERNAPVLRWQGRVRTYARERLTQAMQRAAYEAYRASIIAWNAGYYGNAWQLEMLTDRRVSIPEPDKRQAHMDILAPRLQEQVLPDDVLYSLVGSEWRRLHETELDDMLVKVSRALDAGVGAGEGIPQVFQRVRSAMGIQTDRRQGFTKNFHAVQTIARTGVMEASNQGMDSVYRANADLVAGSEWLASNDERVCPICQALDGTRWPFGDPARRIPPLDAHPNCRCTIIPFFHSEVDTVPDDQAPGMTFAEWAALFGLGLFLDDFINARLASTQV